MTQANAVWYQLKPYLLAFRTHAKLWVIPTVVMTVIAVVYAMCMPRSWRASQAFLVRGEAIGNQNGQGHFGSIDWMKVYQEKILEVARSRKVVSAVLTKLGRPEGYDADDAWPDEDAIDSLQSSIWVTAPRGAEFGRTEFFHLSVTGRSPEIALALCRALSDELEKNLGDLRNANAASVIAELERGQALAKAALEQATKSVEAMEREVGEDLGELRLLTESGSGDSNLRTTLNQISQEIRAAEQARESLQQLKELLSESQNNPDRLLATPSRLLDAQPGLKSLKEGLSAERIELSRLRGIMTESHPKVQQAINSERKIQEQLQHEVETALRGIDADLQANQAQLVNLKKRQADVQQRLDRLAKLRARYHNLLEEARQRNETLDEIQRKLSQSHGAKNAATTSSQLTRFGDPNVGDRPEGPSRKTIAAGGMASGFALGAGLVFLFMPIGPNGRNRRWTDYLNMGRRATDQFLGRRATDMTSSRSVIETEMVGTTQRRMPQRNDLLTQQPVVGGRRTGDITPMSMTPPAAQPPSLPQSTPAPQQLSVPQTHGVPQTPAVPSYPAVDRRSSIGRRAADHGDILP